MDQKKRYYYDLWKDAYSEVGRAEICHAKGITFPIPLGEYDYNHIKQIGGQGIACGPGFLFQSFLPR